MPAKEPWHRQLAAASAAEKTPNALPLETKTKFLKEGIYL